MKNELNRRVNRGFTLIELMIVVAIVAILAAIAYPAYTESVRKGRRAEARTALAEPLARIAANEKFGRWETGDLGNITEPVVRSRQVGQICIACICNDVVGHYDIKSGSDNASVTATAA